MIAMMGLVVIWIGATLGTVILVSFSHQESILSTLVLGGIVWFCLFMAGMGMWVAVASAAGYPIA